MKRTKDWTYDGDYITTVESESEDKTYDIRRTRGVLTCDCASYRFSRAPKDCKHLQAYRGAAPVRASSLVAAEAPVTVTIGKEQFTVRRRAISFTKPGAMA
ncbi:MAG TPA: hypothetical protein VFN64_04850 [Burkholderiaceae bacterium]|nr:hypothetical protein [Burkholderiaceae bacterium]